MKKVLHIAGLAAGAIAASTDIGTDLLCYSNNDCFDSTYCCSTYSCVDPDKCLMGEKTTNDMCDYNFECYS